MPASHGRHRWSDLPLDLLCSILHLLPLKDAIRFGAVCPHWRSAFTAVKKKLSGPKLMLHDRFTRSNTFLTPADDSRPYTICPADDDFYCYSDFLGYFIIGSSNGWLITLRNYFAPDQVYIVDPHTGHTGAQFRLPLSPVTLLPVAGFEIPSISTAIVVPSAPAREGYMVVAIAGSNSLATAAGPTLYEKVILATIHVEGEQEFSVLPQVSTPTAAGEGVGRRRRPGRRQRWLDPRRVFLGFATLRV